MKTYPANSIKNSTENILMYVPIMSKGKSTLIEATKNISVALFPVLLINITSPITDNNMGGPVYRPISKIALNKMLELIVLVNRE